MNDLNQTRARFKQDGFALIKYDDGLVHSYPYDAPWIDDKQFSKIYNKIREHTLVDRPRCYSLFLLCKQIRKLPGDVLEVGTWRGGTAGIFTQMLPDKTIFMADTFEGVVKSSAWEHYEDRAHSDTSEETARTLLNDMNVTNFEILKGIFPEDTGTKVRMKRFSLIYLDLDVYESTKDAFNYVWNKVTDGGVVVFDDYGMISACSGISKFVNEIRDDDDKFFIQNLNGQAYVIKR